jgi:hypothetical protein
MQAVEHALVVDAVGTYLSALTTTDVIAESSDIHNPVSRVPTTSEQGAQS